MPDAWNNRRGSSRTAILRQGFSAAFADHGVGASEADVDAVVGSVKRIGPHPDTTEVLSRLKRRYKLAIFTNSEDNLIAHVIPLLGVPIDCVVTAEQAVQGLLPDQPFLEGAVPPAAGDPDVIERHQEPSHGRH